MNPLRFLTPDLADKIRREWGTPAYVYSESMLRAQAAQVLAFPNAFGLTVRYAMKAASNAAILNTFADCGLGIDASSGFECHRAMRAGIPANRISLSSQEWPSDFAELRAMGIEINACSLNQLRQFAAKRPGDEIGLRVNPGLGSGGTHKTNTGGPASSFGIWHEKLPEARRIAEENGIRVARIHTHIGSGSDPAVWQRVAGLTLATVGEFPDVRVVNLGGGFKVGRMPDERSTDVAAAGAPVRDAFIEFARETGRELHLEIEPGTFLLANAGCLVATVQDVTDTGAEGYRFLKLDTGMTEILRPALYGSQHPLHVFPARPTGRTLPYVAVGHCCETGDLLTPAPERHDVLAPRDLPESVPGDLCVIEGAGAYCAAMSAKGYNSFPEAPEIMVRTDGTPVLIRRRGTLDQLVANEVAMS
jgi:diaminopimelate decarboxylase